MDKEHTDKRWCEAPPKNFAFAQLVCTLTSRRDISSVEFTRAAQHVQVPRGDGSLTSDPLVFADYSSLQPA